MTQTKCENIGKYGCYFLSLIYVAEKITGKHIDVIRAYDLMIQRGIMQSNCYIKDASSVISLLAEQKLTVRHEKVGYKAKAKEYIIARFSSKDYTHFVVKRPELLVEYDPLSSSIANKGTEDEYRVIS